MSRDPLTPIELGYVDLKLAGLSDVEAAHRLGLPAVSKALTRSPRVLAALRQLNEEVAAEVVVTRNNVLRGLLDAVDSAGSATELINAWKEIGRLIGAYEPQRIQVDKRVAVANLSLDKLRAMSVDELLQLASHAQPGTDPAGTDPEGAGS